MKKNKAAIIIMIKNPVLGKAKTRLAATVGDKEALRIYNLLLNHTRTTTSEVDADRYLYYSDFVADDNWPTSLYHKRVQSKGDLGNRMKTAFNEVSENHEKMIIIGSDCAQLQPQHLDKAISALDKSDIVIGPVHDGGYYLLGTKGYQPTVLTDINWSTEKVTQQTLARAETNNLTHTIIDTLSDIDYYEDWEKYGLE